MAADIGQRISGWSCSDLPYNDHSTQDSSVQQMVLNHGSISFGRFAAESLSWEKRSVFEHNRRQEELSKLTAPGLVAQKKAFFEEYYKRARQLKAQGAMHQTEATMDERNDELPADMSEDPLASAPSSSSEPITEVSSSDERKCQDGHELGYLTFNPLFSQTASLQNIQEEERSSSGQKQYLDQEFCTAQTSSNHGFSCEAIERKILASKRVVSNDNGESNVAGSRIVLPRASLQPEGLEVGHEKRVARKSVAIVNRSMKILKDLPTSVIHTQRVDLRSNSESRPSQDLKDPFHKRVEMKLCALSDRWDADRTAASSRSASHQHADRAITSCRSSYQNNDRVATSFRSSLRQNTDRVLATSKLAAQAPQKYLNGVQRSNALPRGVSFNKGSASHVASCNSTATGKLVAKTLVMPSSSQVNARTSKTAQVTLKRSAGLTSINDGSKNKRKQLSTSAALDENNRKRGYVRASASLSARSSSENSAPTAKAPKISNMTNLVAKTEPVQKSRSASHTVGARCTEAKRSLTSEQNRKVLRSGGGRHAESGMSNLKGGPSMSKNKPRQERPRWR
ncbi:protein WVD2-like 7 isoform X2 [Panicum virgatum]|uniref:TPX2 C-terminal domain-containing protein n=2 Tax=Panicum virgatum TaxID=38727 RepID=A0A8T0WR55_PANVG|nr:protein WVD2-like 7 isoform X2 [Panicum virgatum]KAG2651612.1 hypothetical protein PVAP13_1NG293300 [Panicum virgatum]KAG2651616.1 hypothetical protein PVAP13_1NG293300 [Panicum virgatum]